MNNRKNGHGQILYPAAATVESGEVIELTNRIGIALNDAASGETVPLAVEGIFELTKVTNDVVALDAKLYWDADTDKVTLDSGEKYAGLAAKAAGSGVTTVQIDINKGRHS